jgi:hypothetical protein
MQALATKRASAEELGEIRRLLDARRDQDKENRREVRDDRE